MGDTDKLRPEVAEAVERMCTPMGTKYVYTERRDAACMATIRAELLRLADENAALRETVKRLNRRVQVAEAGVAEKVKASAGRSLGRALANAAADTFMHERDEAQAELAALKARIAESAHVEVTLGCAIDGEIPPDLALCKVALVKVEE